MSSKWLRSDLRLTKKSKIFWEEEALEPKRDLRWINNILEKDWRVVMWQMMVTLVFKLSKERSNSMVKSNVFLFYKRMLLKQLKTTLMKKHISATLRTIGCALEKFMGFGIIWILPTGCHQVALVLKLSETSTSVRSWTVSKIQDLQFLWFDSLASSSQ